MKSIVIMGVSGSGKSTIASILSKRLSIPFFEGDNYHSKENLTKMGSSIPLTDEDRLPWLNQLSMLIKNKKCCVSCSALKRSYRDILRIGDPHVLFVYLKANKELIFNRIKDRKDHFFSHKMLESQFDILEEPQADEAHITISVNDSVNNISNEIIQRYKIFLISGSIR